LVKDKGFTRQRGDWVVGFTRRDGVRKL
jgi:hypothetical protein